MRKHAFVDTTLKQGMEMCRITASERGERSSLRCVGPVDFFSCVNGIVHQGFVPRDTRLGQGFSVKIYSKNGAMQWCFSVAIRRQLAVLSFSGGIKKRGGGQRRHRIFVGYSLVRNNEEIDNILRI